MIASSKAWLQVVLPHQKALPCNYNRSHGPKDESAGAQRAGRSGILRLRDRQPYQVGTLGKCRGAFNYARRDRMGLPKTAKVTAPRFLGMV